MKIVVGDALHPLGTQLGWACECPVQTTATFLMTVGQCKALESRQARQPFCSKHVRKTHSSRLPSIHAQHTPAPSPIPKRLIFRRHQVSVVATLVSLYQTFKCFMLPRQLNHQWSEVNEQPNIAPLPCPPTFLHHANSCIRPNNTKGIIPVCAKLTDWYSKQLRHHGMPPRQCKHLPLESAEHWYPGSKCLCGPTTAMYIGRGKLTMALHHIAHYS